MINSWSLPTVQRFDWFEIGKDYDHDCISGIALSRIRFERIFCLYVMHSTWSLVDNRPSLCSEIRDLTDLSRLISLSMRIIIVNSWLYVCIYVYDFLAFYAY